MRAQQILADFLGMIRARTVIFSGYIDGTCPTYDNGFSPVHAPYTICACFTLCAHSVHGMCTGQKTYVIHVFEMSMKNLII